MRYVSAKDVLVIHARIVEKTGGSQGVRDVGMLESAVGAPRQSFDGKDLHQGVFTKAAVLFKKLASIIHLSTGTNVRLLQQQPAFFL